MFSGKDKEYQNISLIYIKGNKTAANKKNNVGIKKHLFV